eukprot:gene24980-213_t
MDEFKKYLLTRHLCTDKIHEMVEMRAAGHQPHRLKAASSSTRLPQNNTFVEA